MAQTARQAPLEPLRRWRPVLRMERFHCRAGARAEGPRLRRRGHPLAAAAQTRSASCIDQLAAAVGNASNMGPCADLIEPLPQRGLDGDRCIAK